MKATLRRFERDAEVEEEQSGGGVFGTKKQMVKVKKHQIGVSLVIELTEEEKAIIGLYGLKELIVEDEPMFSPQKIASSLASYTSVLGREKDTPEGQAKIRRTEQELRSERSYVKLGEYLKSPYARADVFATGGRSKRPLEAGVFATSVAGGPEPWAR
jgi:hypothetical protein